MLERDEILVRGLGPGVFAMRAFADRLRAVALELFRHELQDSVLFSGEVDSQRRCRWAGLEHHILIAVGIYDGVAAHVLATLVLKHEELLEEVLYILGEDGESEAPTSDKPGET